jgi:hypothetical protein
MKTVREWLELIPDEHVRGQALANMWHEYSNDRVGKLSTALRTAFNWYRSPQGIKYWSTIQEEFIKKNL